jgi:sugar phosphate isomerase/epimerase
VQAVGEDDATLILDAFHSWNTNSSPETLRSIPAHRISHYHIDDADPTIPAQQQTDPNRVMLGEGPIDLAGEIRILKEIGYEGTVSLELFNPSLWEQDPADVLKVGLERMRELLNGS